MTKRAAYFFQAYSSIINLPIDQLLQVGNIQIECSSPIPSFDENLLINLCLDAQHIFETEDTILKIDGDVIVVGDIHGSFHDLLRILNFIELNPSQVLFLGDYVDRGNFSVECMSLLFALKVLFPNKYFLLRGNHEFDMLASQYGFKKEILNYHDPKKVSSLPDHEKHSKVQKGVKHINYEEQKQTPIEKLCDQYFENHVNINCYKYTEKLYQSFIDAFSYLPIAAIINSNSLCIHGGLSPLFDKVEKIDKQIQRPIHDYESNQLLADILWGDPSVDLNQSFGDNPRGCGKVFNGASVVQFLKNNNLNRIIRGHECVNSGIQHLFNDKCITVFSSSSYNHEMGNKSGILKVLQNKDKTESIRFAPLPRLKKCDANYYKVQSFDDSSASKPILSRYTLKKFSSFDGIVDKNNESEIHGSQSSTKSTHLYLSNMKAAAYGRRISFNTGVQYKKHIPFPLIPKASTPLSNFSNLNQIKLKNGNETNIASKLPIPTLIQRNKP